MKKILILQGGFNEEHEVSIKTANQIKKILKKNKIDFLNLTVNPKKFEKQISKYSNKLICFNALHGSFGEDGKIQQILKKKNFKYTHSNISSSKICFNKVKSKIIIGKNNIPTPSFVKLNAKSLDIENLYKFKKKYKRFIIKPNESGSSFGIKIIKNNKDFNEFLKKINIYKNEISNHNSLILEKYITGKELTVSVLDINGKLESLGVTEISSKRSFFDYKSKYSKGFSKHILPAKISKKIYKKCLKYALKSHKVLKCNAISRSDFIYDNKSNIIYYLETNSQPGLTPISLVPEQALFRSISFEKIVLDLIDNYNE